MNRIYLLIALAMPKLAVAADEQPPQIEHEPCEFFAQGKDFDLMARFFDESPIFDPKVIYRSGDQGAWRHVPFVSEQGSDTFRARIQTAGAPIEYFIEVFDENGNGPARYGSPEAPVRISPHANPPACDQTNQTEQPRSMRSSEPQPTRLPDPLRVEPTPEPAVAGPLASEPPPPAKTGCAADDPPLYCSGWLWGTVGFVTLAAGGGFAIWYFALRDTDGPPSTVSVTVQGSDPRALRLWEW